MADDGDIDLVLITGAGASKKLGQGSDLPLMSDWSDTLFGELLTSGYHALVGLEKGLDGPTFEDRLGRFLRSATALEQVEQLLEPSAHLPWGGGVQQPSEATLSAWYSQTTHHVRQATKKIRASLDSSFGRDAISSWACEHAYESLFRALGVTPSSRIVLATTNYDMAGEVALDALGYRPAWGENADPLRASPERPLHVDGILDGMPYVTPVLHLHGRVNWIYRPDGSAVSSGPYLESALDDGSVPISMLPGPDKEYEAIPVIESLWESFRSALRRSKRVFVLGHSLNDPRLVAEIVRAFPFGRGVGLSLVKKGSADSLPFDSDLQAELVRVNLPLAKWFHPFLFQPEPEMPTQALLEWIEARLDDPYVGDA